MMTSFMRFLLLLCLFGLLGCRSPKNSADLDLSNEDKLSLIAFIKTQTDEPIQMLHRDREVPSLIKVNTGHELKAFTSSGHLFWVMKTKEGWQVVRRGTWDS
jgi:hypothetical protein